MLVAFAYTYRDKLGYKGVTTKSTLSGSPGSPGSSGSPETTYSSATKAPGPFISNVFCQSLSDKFKRYPGSDPIPDPSLEESWKKSDCRSVPSSWTCQDIADAYSIKANNLTHHPLNMHTTYKEMGCSTKSQYTCQKLSDDNNIFPTNVNVFDPEQNNLDEKKLNVMKSAFKMSAEDYAECTTFPSEMSCQGISNFFGVGDANTALDPNVASALGNFRSRKNPKCTTNQMSCSSIYDTYHDDIPASDYGNNLKSNVYVQEAWDRQKCKVNLNNLGSFTLQENTTVWQDGVPDLFTGNTLKQCTNFCKSNGTCKAVIWKKDSKTCSARSYNTPTQANKNVDTYFKY